jgi:putative ABC transport system ATP-binding protein
VVLNAPSGSGKTTLLRMVLGFIRPDEGSILIQGTLLSCQTVRRLRCACAYVSQDVDFRDQPVRDVFAEIANYPANLKADLSVSALQPFLQRLYLDDDIWDKTIGDLSGGERQRLGIVICAALDRPIWLLDEPLSALDDASARAAVSLLAGTSATVLAVSHHSGLMDSGVFREERF